MKRKNTVISFLLVMSLTAGASLLISSKVQPDKIIYYIADPAKQDLQLYWKDDSGLIFQNIQRLKDHLVRKHRRLVFAMNGGMFKTDYSPLGLFIQQQHLITTLNTGSGSGNFYLKPNGIFYLTNNNEARIVQTINFKDTGQVKYATQSGPMLVIDRLIHPAFTKGSSNLNIRNGVGLLPGNKLLFAMSKESINFYDFAEFFKNQGCTNALYLDGFISRTYLPEKQWLQTDGNLGVIIGLTVAE